MVRIQAFCEHCHHETIVYHLDWTNVSCLACGWAIPNDINDMEVDFSDIESVISYPIIGNA